MHVLSVIKKRREVTQFSATPVPKEDLVALIEAGYYSVAGNNLPSREFIVVDDAATRLTLSRATPFMPWLTSTPLGIVIVGNPQESKYWLQDATIATSNVWLTAIDRGLDAAWGAIHHSEDVEECGRREQIVREALDIPPTLRPVSILGIGYQASPPKEKEMYPLSRVVHQGRFGHRIERLGDL